MKSPNILFVFCILIRILIVYLVYILSKPNILSKNTNYILSLPILILGLSWLIMYIYNLRLKGNEVLDGIIWWVPYRIYHSIFYLLSFILIITYSKYAYIPLLLDISLGFTLFIKEYI